MGIPITILEDFEDNSILNYLLEIGELGLGGVVNPAPDSINPTALVGKFTADTSRDINIIIVEMPRAISPLEGSELSIQLLFTRDEPLYICPADQFNEDFGCFVIQPDLLHTWIPYKFDLNQITRGNSIYNLLFVFSPENQPRTYYFDNITWNGQLPPEYCFDFCYSSDINGISNAGKSFGRGTSSVDIDNDGDIDIFQTDSGIRFPDHEGYSQFHINDGAGNFVQLDMTAEWGIALNHLYGSWQGLFFDSDNDGDQDMLLVNGGFQEFQEQLAFYENNLDINSGFRDITASSGITMDFEKWWNATAGDLNNDGLTDLIITARMTNPDNQGQNISNALLVYMNRGDNVFDEVSESLGLPDPFGDNKNISIFDYNNDGCQDVLLSKYIFGDDNQLIYSDSGLRLFENVDCGASFTEVLDFWNPDSSEQLSFAVSILDFNQDGWQDIYLGRFEKQDFLLVNDRNGYFDKHSADVGIDMNVGQVSPYQNTMGLASGDLFDADGFPDLLIGCGNPGAGAEPVALQHLGYSMKYTQNSADFEAGHYLTRSHGACTDDFDLDGDLDVFWNLGGHGADSIKASFIPALYTNRYVENGGKPAAFIKLVGAVSNRNGLGARVKVKFEGWNDSTETRYVYTRSADGFVSQNSNWLMIPLGSAKYDSASISVQWPSGITQDGITIHSGERLVINELQDPLSTGALSYDPYWAIHPNPTTGTLSIELRQHPMQSTAIRIFDQTGRCVMTETVHYGSVELDLSQFGKGIYFALLVSDGRFSASKKIVVVP